MTERIYALTVVLDQDIREDDVQRLVDAIGMFAYVLTVEQHVADTGLYAATQRAREEIRARLLKALDGE